MRYELTDHEWAAIRPMLPNKESVSGDEMAPRNPITGIAACCARRERPRGCRAGD